MTEEILITDASPHGNFTLIPNVVDDMDLSVYAFRLYFHIKRRAGQNGECWENTRNLAKACGMGATTVSRAKRELADLGLIEIRKVERGHGEFAYDNIIIKDVWALNLYLYAPEQAELRKAFWKEARFTRLLAFLIKQVNTGKSVNEAMLLAAEAHNHGKL